MLDKLLENSSEYYEETRKSYTVSNMFDLSNNNPEARMEWIKKVGLERKNHG